MIGASFESILGYNVSNTVNPPETTRGFGTRKPSAITF